MLFARVVLAESQKAIAPPSEHTSAYWKVKKSLPELF